uniref:Uncharacterized protein n=1 Tax=Rhizophora mucronata TaxID=61149 RepID=A0A2P2PCL6_RHIMU
MEANEKWHFGKICISRYLSWEWLNTKGLS